jgi:hypothetical protein
MIHTREARIRASEIKFIVDPEVGDRIRAWARAHLERDPHGAGAFGDEYDIASLYFDTREYDVLNRRGSFGRAKYRIRRYDASDRVFLERKLRRPSMLIKRRSEVALADLASLSTRAKDREWDGSWFEKRLVARRLRPVCQLSYRRIARGLDTPSGPARLTLDDGVHARPLTHARFEPEGGIRILPDQLILELKFRRDIPVIFRHLVAELRLAPGTASKYRIAMRAVGDPVITGAGRPWPAATAIAIA